MFIKLRETRINVNNICYYRAEHSVLNNRFIVWVSFGNDEEPFLFSSEKEFNEFVDKLDTITKPE